MNPISSRTSRSFAPLAIVLAFTGAPLVACGSAPDSTETTQSQESAVDTAAARKSPCPSALPRAGAACTTDDLLCSWGDDTRFGCRQEARCESGAWTNLTDTCPKKEPSCPLKAPKLSSSGRTLCSAADTGITCVYGDVAYTCASCNGTLCYTDNAWLTSTLPAACPTAVPDFGQACSTPNTVCNYNICAGDYNDDWVFGASVKCESGFWTAYANNICL
jgi:hypothetical protein